MPCKSCQCTFQLKIDHFHDLAGNINKAKFDHTQSLFPRVGHVAVHFMIFI